MNIGEVLHNRAATYPERAAIIYTKHARSHTLTYGELDRAAAQAAGLLYQAGLRPGDVVLIFCPMSPELYIALGAIFRLGLIGMFLDPAAGIELIDRSCSICHPQALIASSRAHLLRFFSPALRRIPLKYSIGLPVPGAVSWASDKRTAPYEQIHPCAPEIPALLTFTSGSTGQPKATVRTHGFLLAQHRALEKSLELMPGEVDLTSLPIFALANLASGVTSLIPDADLQRPAFINSAPVVAQIHAHQPTRTAASPALLERLADYCLKHGLRLPEFRKIFSGGAPVYPRLLEKLQSVAPTAEIITVYGSTEAEPIAHVSHQATQEEDIAAMLGGRGLLVGQPVPEIQLRILPNRWGTPIPSLSREDFVDACLTPDQAGEIVVSGKHVNTSYLNGNGNKETKFTVDGIPWHRTGDAGYLDHRGRLWLLGRCASRIDDAHGTLYPFAGECAANNYPGVCRAAIVSHGGRRILAVEFYDHGARTDLTPLTQALAWVHIDEIQVHKRIPVDKRHNAKIDYPALYKLLGKRPCPDETR